jgi:hypothetical protein
MRERQQAIAQANLTQTQRRLVFDTLSDQNAGQLAETSFAMHRTESEPFDDIDAQPSVSSEADLTHNTETTSASASSTVCLKASHFFLLSVSVFTWLNCIPVQMRPVNLIQL